jgi:hypothetical protein
VALVVVQMGSLLVLEMLERLTLVVALVAQEATAPVQHHTMVVLAVLV